MGKNKQQRHAILGFLKIDRQHGAPLSPWRALSVIASTPGALCSTTLFKPPPRGKNQTWYDLRTTRYLPGQRGRENRGFYLGLPAQVTCQISAKSSLILRRNKVFSGRATYTNCECRHFRALQIFALFAFTEYPRKYVPLKYNHYCDTQTMIIIETLI